MNETLWLAGGLVFLFLLLGVSADITIANVRILGQRLRIAPFSLGLILGVLTSLPEMFIGINATLAGLVQVSFGNLMGGIMVLLGLIAGLAIILDRTIRTSHLFQPKWLWFMGGYMVLPVFLGMDGIISTSDGLFLLTLFLLIINGMFSSARREQESQKEEPSSERTNRTAIILAFWGAFGIMAASHFIVSFTLRLTNLFALPLFFTGLIAFSLGTNLPELSVVVTSWRRGVKRLALGNILGSAFTNSLVVGILALLRPISLRTPLTFWIFFVLLTILVFLYIYFGLTDRKFTRTEGVVLLSLYILFLLSEFGCLLLGSSICLR